MGARFWCMSPFVFLSFLCRNLFFLLHNFFPKFKVSSLCIYINISILSLYVYFPFLRCHWMIFAWCHGMIFAHYFWVVMLPMVAYLRIYKVRIVNMWLLNISCTFPYQLRCIFLTCVFIKLHHWFYSFFYIWLSQRVNATHTCLKSMRFCEIPNLTSFGRYNCFWRS